MPPAFPGTLLSHRRSAPDFDFSALNCTTYLNLVSFLSSQPFPFIYHIHPKVSRASQNDYCHHTTGFLMELLSEQVSQCDFMCQVLAFFLPQEDRRLSPLFRPEVRWVSFTAG